MPNEIDATQFANLIGPGTVVYVGASSNEPVGLLRALQAQSDAAAGVTFIQFPLPGMNTFDFTALHDAAHMKTFFMTPNLRDGAAAGRVHFMPMQMRFVYEYLKRQPLDFALLQGAPDAQGSLRLGPNVDFAGAAMESAKTVVLEVNRGLVAPAGAPRVAPSSVDYIFESTFSPVTMAQPKIDAAATAIGAYVADLIRDGDCIQTGIGAIPAAILAALGDKNDLGLHGGLIDDGGMALIERGVVNGSRKRIDPGVHVTGMALGTERLHEWLAQTPSVVFRGADYTHEINVIRQLEQFVSINSAVEVDVHGQVNAEVAGGRQISGTGGSVDFMRAARVSKGGRSIVAMNATARGGSVSRIVAKVEMVTALRTDVDLVVTEFGVADLGCSASDERFEALVAIAHPDFRAELGSQ